MISRKDGAQFMVTASITMSIYQPNDAGVGDMVHYFVLSLFRWQAFIKFQFYPCAERGGSQGHLI
ncbi:hypothetical protein MASR2M36_01490 [Providencia sp.]